MVSISPVTSAEVQRLGLFRQVLERLDKSRVRVLENSLRDLLAAAPVSQQAGLLVNDALIVALMQANSLTKLASHDADFDTVAGITRYAPA